VTVIEVNRGAASDRAPRRAAATFRALTSAACAALLGVCAVALGACAIAPGTRTVGPSAASTATVPSGEPSGALPPGSAGSEAGGSSEAGAERGRESSRAASNVLVERSRAAREAGSYDVAAASIERALRISPDDPSLWLELAEVKLEAGDRQQASVMARKAVALAGGDREISARAERLIDAANR
jgi:tetratricopeptide (TPR) repeat protein